MMCTKRRYRGRSRRASVPVMLVGAYTLALLGSGRVTQAVDRSGGAAYVDINGTAHVPAEDIPLSRFMSPQAKGAFISFFSHPSNAPAINGPIAPLRAYFDKYNRAQAAKDRRRFPVFIRKETLNGVRTEVVVPKGGVAPMNRDRVLINVHGGAFLWGEGAGGEVESIPIASVGRIEVVTVAYREGPEYKFPAASEDVAAVYRALLEKYRPEDIGIYGCSAGGILTAESIAWFEKVKLPIPGAIGTFCGSASEFGGDTAYLAFSLTAEPPLPGAKSGELTMSSYFSNASLEDPLVLPINSKAVLRRFPPTLLIGASRDFTLSSMFHAQAVLADLGVDAELHVWDGMWHSFFGNPDLPESQQAYRVIAKFFADHLGRVSQRPCDTEAKVNDVQPGRVVPPIR